ncbi:hypothetical protein HYW21_06755 [Candidatus Woesearchaeota archaeon]|nr:hypothetical protein [Candidatus Woesearchaeota archaeon]
MYQESIVLRNLAVLKRLTKSDASLDEIASSAGYRARPVERSLRLLSQQGLVEQIDGVYRFCGDASQVGIALQLIDPWLNSANESFYEIARDTAAILHGKSWANARLEGVLLYGSTLRSDKPRDIDLVILHSGSKLIEFTPSRYADEGTKEIYDVEPDHPSTRRLDAWSTLSTLGYRGKSDYDIKNRAVRFVGERIESLDAGSVPEERVQSFMSSRECPEADVAAYLDIYGVSNVFDVHVLHTGLLGDQGAEQRSRAIASCNDPTFWHRVLSEGKLYDPKVHDFTLTIEEKYPGALQLFAAE